jgi:hypothetical protein
VAAQERIRRSARLTCPPSYAFATSRRDAGYAQGSRGRRRT